MQPFLSAETTMVYPLTILTFIFLAAAGMDMDAPMPVQEPVHVPVAKPVAAPVPQEKIEIRLDPVLHQVSTVNITDRLRSTLRQVVFSNSTWRKHAIWSTWSVQGWNFPLWRRNYFGKQQRPRGHTISSTSRATAMVDVPGPPIQSSEVQ